MIDEYPIMSLPRILDDVKREGIMLSQINLVCRVNDITAHENVLKEALLKAQKIM